MRFCLKNQTRCVFPRHLTFSCCLLICMLPTVVFVLKNAPLRSSLIGAFFVMQLLAMELEIIYFLLMTESRFLKLNLELTNMIGCCDIGRLSRVKQNQIDVQSFSVLSMSSILTVKYLKSMHDLLCDVSELINDTFSLQFLILTTIRFILVTASMFVFTIFVSQSSISSMSGLQGLSAASCFIYHTLILLAVLRCTTQVSFKVRLLNNS